MLSQPSTRAVAHVGSPASDIRLGALGQNAQSAQHSSSSVGVDCASSYRCVAFGLGGGASRQEIAKLPNPPMGETWQTQRGQDGRAIVFSQSEEHWAVNFLQYVAYYKDGQVIALDQNTQKGVLLDDMLSSLTESRWEFEAGHLVVFKLAIFDYAQGCTRAWLCLPECYTGACLHSRQGKASLWIQTRLSAWTRLCSRLGLPPTWLRRPVHASKVVGGNDEGRVLDWIGSSSVGFVAVLVSTSSSKPHLGGLKDGDHAKMLPMLAAACRHADLSSIEIRVDKGVSVAWGFASGMAVMSKGLVVTLPVMQGAVVDLRLRRGHGVRLHGVRLRRGHGVKGLRPSEAFAR